MLKKIRKIGAWTIVILTLFISIAFIVADGAFMLALVLPIGLSTLIGFGITMLVLEKIFS